MKYKSIFPSEFLIIKNSISYWIILPNCMNNLHSKYCHAFMPSEFSRWCTVDKHMFHWTNSFTHSTPWLLVRKRTIPTERFTHSTGKVKYKCQAWLTNYSIHAIVSIHCNFRKHMTRTSISLFTQLTFNWWNERTCIFHAEYHNCPSVTRGFTVKYPCKIAFCSSGFKHVIEENLKWR
jgi:hypothetical protein